MGGKFGPLEGDNALASVRPFVCALTAEDTTFIRVISSLRCLCVCNQWVYADNRVNVVDRLLIQYDFI